MLAVGLSMSATIVSDSLEALLRESGDHSAAAQAIVGNAVEVDENPAAFADGGAPPATQRDTLTSETYVVTACGRR